LGMMIVIATAYFWFFGYPQHSAEASVRLI
jgi:hypothetical protein